MDKDEIIKELAEEIARLKEQLQTTKEHLKKYTAPVSRKEYYVNNKEAIKERVKNYKPTPEQKKEYNKQAYLRRKENLKKETGETPNI